MVIEFHSDIIDESKIDSHYLAIHKRRKIVQLLLEESTDIEEVKSTFKRYFSLIMPQIKQLDMQNNFIILHNRACALFQKGGS